MNLWDYEYEGQVDGTVKHGGKEFKMNRERIYNPDLKMAEVRAAAERRDRYKMEARAYFADVLQRMIEAEEDLDVTHLMRREARAMAYADKQYAEYLEYIEQTYI